MWNWYRNDMLWRNSSSLYYSILLDYCLYCIGCYSGNAVTLWLLLIYKYLYTSAFSSVLCSVIHLNILWKLQSVSMTICVLTQAIFRSSEMKMAYNQPVWNGNAAYWRPCLLFYSTMYKWQYIQYSAKSRLSKKRSYNDKWRKCHLIKWLL
jgi:hypothetical protein